MSIFHFELIHADIWTSPITSPSGYKFYLVLLDDFSHYIWTFPLRQNPTVYDLLVQFSALIQTQFHAHLPSLFWVEALNVATHLITHPSYHPSPLSHPLRNSSSSHPNLLLPPCLRLSMLSQSDRPFPTQPQFDTM